MNSRGRYLPGIGVGRGGGLNSNPGFQSRPPQQHYVQRNFVQNHHQFHHQHQHQQQQQQQSLRRNQFPGSNDSSVVDEVEKTIQSEAIDSRSVLVSSHCFVGIRLFVFQALSILVFQHFLNITLFYTFWAFQITSGNKQTWQFVYLYHVFVIFFMS